LLEAPKETGNELLNKINWKIHKIKIQQFLHKEIAKVRCSEKIVFTVTILLVVPLCIICSPISGNLFLHKNRYCIQDFVVHYISTYLLPVFL